MEIKTEADSNDFTEFPYDEKPCAGMFCFILFNYLFIYYAPTQGALTTTTTKTFITRKFAEAANARSVDSTEEKRLQSLFEDIQRDVR